MTVQEFTKARRMDSNDQELEEIARWYRWFSVNETAGHSPLWAEVSEGIANERKLLVFLASLPKEKRQPNLFLASYRSLFGIPDGFSSFRSVALQSFKSIADRMMERSTQTNEPGRCAVLLPLIAKLPQPLAIVEVGAAAGLCLLLDRYAYRYGNQLLLPDDTVDAPIFECNASANTPLPDRVPKIAWRAGLDLNPLDVDDDAQMEWLETLVWPGQDVRVARLRKAVAVARHDPPQVARGSLSADLEALIKQVPAGLTTVVFHSAVLNYLPTQKERDDFSDRVMVLADHWIANESPLVLPRIAANTTSGPDGAFLMSLDGAPVAWTDPHGASLNWID